MRRDLTYIPDDSIYPFGGLDYSDPSTLVDTHLSPDMLNVNVNKGHLQKRRGFSSLGGAVNGTPLAIFEFETLSGVTHLLLITTTHEYRLDTGTGLWTKITFKDVGAVEHTRTGTEEDGIDWVVATGFDSTGTLSKWVIITNGVDKPRYWDGTLATFYEYSTATVANHGAALEYTGLVTMKTISVINNYVVLGNTTTVSNEPTTIVWGDTGSLTNFGTGATPGNSGAVPLTDANGAILKLEPLGDRLMIYEEDSIHAMTHIGGIGVFSFEKILSGTRLLSPRGIVNVRGFHMFMAQENILLFDGSRSLRPVGDKIALKYREEIRSDLRRRAFGFLDVARNQIYWAVPVDDLTTVFYKMEYDEYDLGNIRWTKLTYFQRMTAMGFWRRTTTLHWNDASLVGVLWSSLAMNWNQGAIKGGFPQRVLGYSGATGLENEIVWQDNGVDVPSNVDTIDFTTPKTYLSELARWVQIELELLGTTCDVYYSKDRGTNFVLVKEKQVLTGAWRRYKFDIDTVSEQLRIRVANARSNGFELRWLRLWVTPAGER